MPVAVEYDSMSIGILIPQNYEEMITPWILAKIEDDF
jgi:hypothetical protein